MNPTVVKVCFFVAGLVLGGAVVFGITRLTDQSSSSANGSDSSTNGTRSADSLQFVIVVSTFHFILIQETFFYLASTLAEIIDLTQQDPGKKNVPQANLIPRTCCNVCTKLYKL